MEKPKVINRLIKIAKYIVLALVLLLLLIQIVASSSVVQTYVGNKGAIWLGKKLNTTVYFKEVQFDFPKAIVLNDIYIEDLHQDTLLYVKSLKVNANAISLSKNSFVLAAVQLENPHVELKQYPNEEGLNFQFILDAFASTDTASGTPIALKIANTTIKEGQFSFIDYTDTTTVDGINFKSLGISGINLKTNAFNYQADSIKLVIDQFQFQEKSGFQLKDLKGACKVSSSGIALTSLELLTPKSDFMGDLQLNYNKYADFSDFVNKVDIHAVINSSFLNTTDLAFFTAGLKDIQSTFDIAGKMKGPLGDFDLRDLAIGFGEQSHLSGRLSITGLPDIDNSFISLSIKKFNTNKKDIDHLLASVLKGTKFGESADYLNRLGTIGFKGDFTGFVNDFVTYGKFTSNVGNIKTDLGMRLDTATNNFMYKGSVATQRLDLGSLADYPDLGAVKLAIDVQGKGLKPENIEATIDGKIDQLAYRGYAYEDIVINGAMNNQKFEGLLTVRDTNLYLDFDGQINLEEQLPRFNFSTDIAYADLFATHILDRDSTLILKAKADINFKGNSIDNSDGQIVLTQLNYTEGGKQLKASNIKLKAQPLADEKLRLNLASDFIDGEIIGDIKVDEMLPSLKYAIGHVVPLYAFDWDTKKANKQQFNFNFDVKNITPITRIFYPDLHIPKELAITGNYNSVEEQLALNLESSTINFRGRSLDSLQMGIKVADSLLTMNLFSEQLSLSDSVVLSDFNLKAFSQSDSLELHTDWDSNGLEIEKDRINLRASIVSKDSMEAHFFDTYFHIANNVWQVNENHAISIDSNRVSFDQLSFSNQARKIELNGTLSDFEGDELTIDLTQFDLHFFDFLLADYAVDLDGMVEGKAVLAFPQRKMRFKSNLTFTDVIINEEELGSGYLASRWNPVKETININSVFQTAKYKTLVAKGNYATATDRLSFKVNFNTIPLQTFSPLLGGVISNLEGTTTGDIRIRGKATAPQVSGNIGFNNTSFVVGYLGTKYHFTEQAIAILKNRLVMKDFKLLDDENVLSVLNGKITHENFKNFKLDLTMNSSKGFQFLNTTKKDNDLFYGNAYVDSALINVSGPFDEIVLDVKAKADKGTEINLPLSGPTEVSGSEFIMFKSDALKVENKKNYKADLKGIQLNFDLEITDDAKIQLIYDETVGDVMKATGNGNIKLEINTLGDFNIYGDYVIKEGDYLFTLQNVINKKFLVASGSKVTFNGDPYDATLDIDAIYKVRTTLQPLTGRSTDSRRVPVECHLLMTEKLSNPNIVFDIQTPSALQETKDAVSYALQREGEMEKQSFALLVLGGFTTPQQNASSTGGGSVSLGKSSSELISNQLSNWLSQISNDFDIGLNYLPGDELNQEELEVALSTQFFNDRLSIEGSFEVTGQDETATSSTSNNLIGDVKVEYKITEDGRFRLKAFNKSNDYNLIDANNARYTQGIGVFYLKEFDSFKGLFNR